MSVTSTMADVPFERAVSVTVPPAGVWAAAFSTRFPTARWNSVRFRSAWTRPAAATASLTPFSPNTAS